MDTSPLRQTRAGTARYLDGLLAGLERVPDVQVQRLAFGGPGRGSALVRDTWWYLAALPGAARGGFARLRDQFVDTTLRQQKGLNQYNQEMVGSLQQLE